MKKFTYLVKLFTIVFGLIHQKIDKTAISVIQVAKFPKVGNDVDHEMFMNFQNESVPVKSLYSNI